MIIYSLKSTVYSDSVFTQCLFLSQDPTQDNTSHVIVSLHPLYCDSLPDVPCFGDPDGFEYWSGILQTVAQLGIVCCFSSDQARVIGLGRNSRDKEPCGDIHHII